MICRCTYRYRSNYTIYPTFNLSLVVVVGGSIRSDTQIFYNSNFPSLHLFCFKNISPYNCIQIHRCKAYSRERNKLEIAKKLNDFVLLIMSGDGEDRCKK